MVRPNRVKSFEFGIGSLTADSSGNLNSYAQYPITGVIQRVTVEKGNWTKTGSLFVLESGGTSAMTRNILTIYSGTARDDGLNSNHTVYPGAYPLATAESFLTGSPNTIVPQVINGILCVSGAGLGTGTSGLNVVVEYI